IFDADFVPPHDFLRRTVVEFADPRVGLVQARWGHTNRTQSLLTRIQALLLDGHFVVEQQARHIAGFLFNFNGTAGVFRRGCIEDAGGWQHDTLTEDLDLSYRAQLRGWRFVYLPTLCCPAELPTDMNSFLTQQHRWAKGSIQTGRKLLGAVWRAPLSGMAKLEGTFHLLGNIAFPLLLAVILTALPIHALRQASGQGAPALLGAIESAPLLLA
ncbi:MAG: glycosyltransferase, partial [Myxococcales bacterium]|nr:glycosyltransferase [Myxococcales bacterium]